MTIDYIKINDMTFRTAAVTFDVKVLRIDSPSSFFCRLITETKSVAKEIDLAIEKYIRETATALEEADSEVLDSWERYAVKFKNHWVRACGLNNKEVWLVDLASTLPIDGNIFYELPAEFKNIASDVFHCGLDKVLPKIMVFDPIKNLTNVPLDNWVCDNAFEDFIRQQLSNTDGVQLKVRRIYRPKTRNDIMVLGDILFSKDGQTHSLSKELVRSRFALKDRQLFHNALNKLHPHCTSYMLNESRNLPIFKTLITPNLDATLNLTSNVEHKDPIRLSERTRRALKDKTIVLDGIEYNRLELMEREIVHFNMALTYSNFTGCCMRAARETISYPK